MLIRSFASLLEAERAITQPDEEYVFLRHVLTSGDVVQAHVENKNECLLIRKGSFVLQTGIGNLNYPDLVMDIEGEDTIVVFIPAGTRHGLKALSNLDYFVLKA